jgi:replicative DNA helicase
MSERSPRNRTSTTAGAKPDISRLPPHSQEVEQAVLGCILLAPDSCLIECIQKIKPGHLAFYDLRHQELYAIMLQMWEEMEPIDGATFPTYLRDRNKMEAVGGLAYISTLPDATPSAANLEYWIDILLEKYLARKMIQTCTGIVQRIFDNEGEMDELLDSAEADILKFSQERVAPSIIPTKELVQRAIAQIEEFHQNQGILTGVGTGLIDFDKMTTGLHGGEMIVIAARPSIGKTSIAMNIAEHVVLEQKLPVGVFSLEMTADSVMLRMVCSKARVNIRNVRDGFLAERDFPRLIGAAGQLAGSPLHIDDSGGLTILQLRAKARQMWQMHGIKLFIIDYIQLLQAPLRRVENRQQEVAQISGGIKALAKELNVPIIVLCQLNREVEKRGADSRPRLSELRESGQIEADADLVGLLFKNAKNKNDEDDIQEDREAIPVTLFIAKQRNGPTGDINLTFLRSITRFESAAKVSSEDANYNQPHND